MPTSIGAIAAFAIVAAVLSAILVRLSIAYAHRRALIDAPGQRRSHSTPTPRGGGIGIVLAIVAVGLLPLVGEAPVLVGTTIAALAAVAIVGWVDDHRPLLARVRFLTHVLSAAAVIAAAAGFIPNGVVMGVVLVGLVAWSINLHNFMDGINGILGLQAAFVFAVVAAYALLQRHFDVALVASVATAATLGFLPFNVPRAKVFMGDVGSGALGFLVAILLLFAVHRGTVSAVSAALVPSAFVVDATATLLHRMQAGKRWWKPHREHLYQWLHRSGRSHLEVDALYLGWNVLVVLPLVVGVERVGGSRYAWLLAAAVYAAAFVLWVAGKRACLDRVSR